MGEDYHYRITYLPYEYMKNYPDMTEDKIEKHLDKWEETIKKFNKNLENTEDSEGNYLINFMFNDND